MSDPCGNCKGLGAYEEGDAADDGGWKRGDWIWCKHCLGTGHKNVRDQHRHLEALMMKPRIEAARLADEGAEPVAFVRDWFSDKGARMGYRLEMSVSYPDNLLYAGMPLFTRPAPPAQEASPIAALVAALRADADYAWSWHCNIAMAVVDEGGAQDSANRGAARFLHMLAGINPTHPDHHSLAGWKMGPSPGACGDELEHFTTPPAAAVCGTERIPEVLFDSYAIWRELDEPTRRKVGGVEGLSAALDAVVRIMRAAPTQPSGEKP